MYWIVEKIVSQSVQAKTEEEAIKRFLDAEKDGLVSMEIRAFEDFDEDEE